MALAALVFLLFAATACNAARVGIVAQELVADPPTPPVFPTTYTVKYTVTLPHMYLQQPEGLVIPVHAWFDGPSSKLRMDTFNGLNSYYNLQAEEFNVYPRYDKITCSVFVPGPVMKGQEQQQQQQRSSGAGAAGMAVQSANIDGGVLPDLTGWTYGGTFSLGTAARMVHIWQFQRKEDNKVSQYTFYTDVKTGAPVKFHMFGVNYITGGHFDEYLYDFSEFTPKIQGQGRDGARNVFTPPAVCNTSSAHHTAAPHPLSLQMRALAPHVHAPSGAHAYLLWSKGQGRVHGSHEELETRLARFLGTAERIQAHNADASKAFKMKLNKYADWSDEEFYAVMTPKRLMSAEEKDAMRARGKLAEGYTPAGKFKPHMKRHELPVEVDWRGTGADPGVKDQGMCGSCFAFSATGSMEGVWYVATGEHRSFSEQMMVDCTWDFGPQGCSGGDYEPVFNWVAAHGGIALEQQYPYKSVNDFCKAANVSRPGQFEGYLEIEARDEAALMEAVFTLGPISVPVDAGPDSFRYYSEGVWSDPDCHIKPKELDHAVVLFGYGTTKDGIDYWLVRNSWAKFYGDDGYVKIARGKGDCGISSEPVAALPSASASKPGAETRRLEAVRRWH